MLLQATRAADVPCKLNNENHAIKSTLDKTKKTRNFKRENARRANVILRVKLRARLIDDDFSRSLKAG